MRRAAADTRPLRQPPGVRRLRRLAVGAHEGRPTLLARIAEARPNVLLSATARRGVPLAMTTAAAQLAALGALFPIVTVTGRDETSGQTVQARETYVLDGIGWGHRCADILSTADGGVTPLDHARSHDVEPVGCAADGPG